MLSGSYIILPVCRQTLPVCRQTLPVFDSSTETYSRVTCQCQQASCIQLPSSCCKARHSGWNIIQHMSEKATSLLTTRLLYICLYILLNFSGSVLFTDDGDCIVTETFEYIFQRFFTSVLELT